MMSFGFFRRMLFFLCLGMVILLSWTPVFAQEGDSAHIELILDASGSMWAKLGKSTRIEVAKEALNKIIDDLSERKGIAVGLRVYGHRTNDCKDTKLEIPIGPLDAKKMKKFINGIKPKGKTPIAYSLEQAARDFMIDFKGNKIVILVTDGLESCNGDPCAAAKALAEKGIVSKIHVVGFGMDKKSVSQLECIVEPSGGLLLEANNADELAKAFDTIVKTALDVNLEVKGLDKKGNPSSMTVTIMKDGDEVLSESGETVRQNVPEGSYLIRAVASGTEEEIFFEGVDLVSDQLTSLEAVFSLSRIQVRGVDSSGSPVNVSWEIFLKENRETPEREFSATDWKTEILAPGEYFVRGTHQETKAVQSFDLALADGDQVKKELSFAQGKLVIKTLDSSGKPLYTDSNVYKSPYDRDNPEEVDRDGGETHEYILVPGTYDIVVRDNSTKVEQWIKDVVIDGGKTVRREVSFAQGSVKLTGKGFSGKPVYFYVDAFASPAGEEENPILSESGEGGYSFIMVPGKYDLKVHTDLPPTVIWEREVEVVPGKKIAREFNFPAARTRFIAPQKDGERTYVYVDVFVHPADENEDLAASESGHDEYIQIFLVPGTYDFRIHDDDGNEVWFRGIELAADETFSKEVKYEE
ncbi:MAG: VWA domain-containing protein [Synergistaceae bacterium]|nr:VWA domain-containing protein [Synergistaceae bacterium]